MSVIENSLLSGINNFYSRQAHLIDCGQHDSWARTFTDEGEFHSPTYGKPAVAYEQLHAISAKFADSANANGEQHHHIMQNIWVQKASQQQAEVQAYMLIVSVNKSTNAVTPLRLVTINDDLQNQNGVWLVAKRVVTY